MIRDSTQQESLYQHIEAIRLGLIHLQGGAHRWWKGSYIDVAGPDGILGTMRENVCKPDECAVCMWGAAHFGAFVGNLADQWLSPVRETIMEAASKRLFGTSSVPGFNDAPSTTYEMALERYTLIYADILAHYGLPADWKLEVTPCSA